MRLLAKSLLYASLTLLSATIASANVVAPSNNAGSYVGAVYSIMGNNLSGVSYSVHPTYVGCNQGLSNIVNTVFTYNGVITQVIPCHYVPGPGPVEVDPEPMSPERVIGGLQQTQELRDRYDIDAYERELHRLWRAEGDGSDGGR